MVGNQGSSKETESTWESLQTEFEKLFRIPEANSKGIEIYIMIKTCHRAVKPCRIEHETLSDTLQGFYTTKSVNVVNCPHRYKGHIVVLKYSTPLTVEEVS